MTRRGRSLTLLLLPALLAAACGGEESAGSSPTDSTPTDEPSAAVDGTAVTVVDGFLSLDLPEGWEIVTEAEGPPAPAHLAFDDEWSLGDGVIHDLVEVSNGSLSTFLGVEPLYELAPEADWATAVIDALRAEGAELETVEESEWGDGSSRLAVGSAGGQHIELELARVGTQLVGALTNGPEPLAGTERRDVDSMLDSITFDESMLSPLQNGFEAGIHIGPEASGQGDFHVSTLVPTSWSPRSGEVEVGQIFRGGRQDQSYVHFLPVHARGTLGEQVSEELGRLPAELVEGLVPESDVIDGVPVEIFREGEPGAAVSGMLYASDGVVFLGVYLDTVDDPDLFEAMLAHLRFHEHHG